MTVTMGSDQATLPTGVPVEESAADRSGGGSIDDNPAEAVGNHPDYPTGESVDQDYWFYISHCKAHPHPGRNILGDEQHHQFSTVTINASTEYNEQLKTVLTPDECSCGGSIKSREVGGSGHLMTCRPEL